MFNKLTVTLIDGKILCCKNIHNYENNDIKKFLIDKDGNIAIYVEVTDIATDNNEGSATNIDTFIDTKTANFTLTFIPKQQIKYI